jgi:hypothetical protein
MKLAMMAAMLLLGGCGTWVGVRTDAVASGAVQVEGKLVQVTVPRREVLLVRDPTQPDLFRGTDEHGLELWCCQLRGRPRSKSGRDSTCTPAAERPVCGGPWNVVVSPDPVRGVGLWLQPNGMSVVARYHNDPVRFQVERATSSLLEGRTRRDRPVTLHLAHVEELEVRERRVPWLIIAGIAAVGALVFVFALTCKGYADIC